MVSDVSPDLLTAGLRDRLLGSPTLRRIRNPSGIAFNICIVSFNEHDRLYDDVMRTTYASLIDLGYDCSLTENALAAGRVNIVMGNLVHPAGDKARVEFLTKAPFLLYQLEPLSVLETLPAAAGYFDLLDMAAHVIEYSPSGFAFLGGRRWAGKASLLPPSFHRCLEITRPAASRDIDVLFYGSHSDRRARVMDDLRARGFNAVHLFGAYGDQLWDHIRRSRIVLNMHYRDGFDVLETVRIVPLLANRCFVVSERGDHNPFGDGIILADHAKLADTCVSYLQGRADEREQVAAEGYLAVRRLDMASLLDQTLQTLDVLALVARTTAPSAVSSSAGDGSISGVGLYRKSYGDGRRHDGIDYISFLKKIREAVRPRTYLEIGTNRGDSLRQFDCDALCIDPDFLITQDVLLCRGKTVFFQTKSDDFFRNHDVGTYLPEGVDVAFLDGLHHFEATLRDFINVERVCNERSAIIIHDCLPIDLPMTSRTFTGGMWTGDVWRLLPIFKRHRPDLRIACFDCPPTGLVVCTGLDRSSTVLSDRYYEILNEFSNMHLDADALEQIGMIYPYFDSARLSNAPDDLPLFFG